MTPAAVLVAEDEDDDAVELRISCPTCGREVLWHVGVDDFPECDCAPDS